MSQRDSGYARKELDCYETPEWVTEAFLPHLPYPAVVWEPACGSKKMAGVLSEVAEVWATDIIYGQNFMDLSLADYPKPIDAIITNPPYSLAVEFIERAMSLVPFVAMLLRTDFDHAKSRQHLFGGCPTFAKKIVLTKRIRWFEDSTGAPSFNHAWYVWSRKHGGPPSLAYAPLEH